MGTSRINTMGQSGSPKIKEMEYTTGIHYIWLSRLGPPLRVGNEADL